MNSWLQEELFGPEEDERSPIAKTFESTDPFNHDVPDTTSEFARLHSPQAAELMNRAFMQHRPLSKAEIDSLGTGRRVEKRFAVQTTTLNKDHYVRAMRTWLAKGEDIITFVTGCDPSIQDELRELAKAEGLL
jgi:hypothetical protein